MDGRRNSAFIGRRATESTFGAGTHETEMPLKAVWASSGERGAGCLQVSAQPQHGRQQEHGAPAELSPFPSLIVCLHPHPPCCLTRRTHQGWAGFPRARSRSGFGPKLRAHLQCEKLFSTSDKTKQNPTKPRGGGRPPSWWSLHLSCVACLYWRRRQCSVPRGLARPRGDHGDHPQIWTLSTGRALAGGAAAPLQPRRSVPCSPLARVFPPPGSVPSGPTPAAPRRGLPDPDPRLLSPRRGFGPGPSGQGGGDGSAGAGVPPG